MFGWGEIGLIVLLAIILLGPNELSTIARKLGRLYGEYQRARKQLELELMYGYEIPTKETLEKILDKNINVLSSELIEDIERIRRIDR